MSRKIIFAEKAEIESPGATLSEIKIMRQEGRLSYGPEGTVKINRFATEALDSVDAMDQESVMGVNSIPEGQR